MALRTRFYAMGAVCLYGGVSTGGNLRPQKISYNPLNPCNLCYKGFVAITQGEDNA